MTLHDLRFAVRSLLRRPGYAAVAVVTLALGIGANTAIWSFADAVAFRPLPVAEPARLVAPFATDAEGGLLGFSFPDYVALRRELTRIEELAAFVERPVAVGRGAGAPELTWAMLVSEGYFPLLGVKPAVGRFFGPGEGGRDGRGGEPVAVLSHQLYENRFGGDPAVVGESVRINGHPFTVIGVAPAGFLGTRLLSYAPEVWLPVSQHAAVIADSEGWLESAASGSFQLLGRLAAGVGHDEAAAELAAAAQRAAAPYPEEVRRSGTLLFSNRTAINPFASPPAQVRRLALLALVGVAAVLLVACGNVASLGLARSSSRSRELAVRASLGARRGALVRQLLAESSVLAAAGGAAGLLVGWGGSRAIGLLMPKMEHALSIDPRLDGRAVVFTAGAALLAALASGLLPALRASTTDPAGPLRAGHDGLPGRRQRLRQVLVGAQVAFSVVVLVAGGLFVRSLKAARGMELGFEPTGAVVFGVAPMLVGHDAAGTVALVERLADDLRALPGVTGVTWADDLPLDGNSSSTSVGRPGATRDERVSTFYQSVAPGYVEVLGIPLLAGRDFTAADREREVPAVMVSAALAERLWEVPERAVGQRLQLGGSADELYEVVAVAADVKVNWLGAAAQPTLYFDVRRDAGGRGARSWLVVRHGAAPPPSAAAVRAAVAAADPRLPSTRLESFVAHLAPAFAPAENGAWLAGAFGLLALALATAGVYGVLAYSVAQRVREVAIRMAVGATPRRVVRELLGHAVRLLGGGLLVGLAAAVAVGQLLRGLLYGVGAADPPTFVGVAALLLAVGLAAAIAPARRALRVEPAVALRSEP